MSTFNLRTQRMSWKLHEIALQMSEMKGHDYIVLKMINALDPLYQESKVLAALHPDDEIIQHNYQVLQFSMFELVVISDAIKNMKKG